MKKLKEEVEKKGLKLSVKENWKEGKSKMIASCRFLEGELRQCKKGEGVTLADKCGNAWSGLENQRQEVGSKRKSEKKKVQCEVFNHKEE